MENGTILPKPKYGYSLEHPTKGKVHYYVTLALAICLPLSYIVILLIQGPDYMHAWWEAAKLDGNKSPQILGMTPLTVIGIALIISHSAIVKGWKRTLACIGCGAFIAWFYEFLGTNTVGGGVFGPYHYNSETLPWHIFGVPFCVAIGWEIFAYPAFYMVLYLLPSEELGEEKSFFKRLCNNAAISSLGGLFCVVTDFFTDPISVDLGFFTWHVNGDSIFMWLKGSGEPLTNFTGWFICGFTMMLAFCYILQTTPSKRHVRSKYLDIYFPLTLYSAYFLINLTIELIFQQRGDVIIFGLFGHGGVCLILLVKLYLQKQGVQPHPVGQVISNEGLRKCMEREARKKGVTTAPDQVPERK